MFKLHGQGQFISLKNFDIPVAVCGRDPVAKLEDFNHPGFDPIRHCIEKMSYSKPLPLQQHAISIAMAGRDLMTCAQTGSGQTAAFLFPMICSALGMYTKHGPPPPARVHGCIKVAPVVLVLAPTPSAARQIYSQARKFTWRTGLRPVCIYDDTSHRVELQDLYRGCDILIATPVRLVQYLEHDKISLEFCAFLCLDEADCLLNLGFEPQIRQIVKSSNMPQTASARQTLMFSATFTKEVQHLASDVLHDNLFLTVGRRWLCIVVNNLPIPTDQKEIPKFLDVLRNVFADTVKRNNDRITHVNLPTNYYGDTLGYAFIEFTNVKSVEDAVKYGDGFVIGKRTINVKTFTDIAGAEARATMLQELQLERQLDQTAARAQAQICDAWLRLPLPEAYYTDHLTRRRRNWPRCDDGRPFTCAELAANIIRRCDFISVARAFGMRWLRQPLQARWSQPASMNLARALYAGHVSASDTCAFVEVAAAVRVRVRCNDFARVAVGLATIAEVNQVARQRWGWAACIAEYVYGCLCRRVEVQQRAA
jgi:hypothetical protein